MKKIINLILFILICFTTTCNAEALYKEYEYNLEGKNIYESSIFDIFSEANIGIGIHKARTDLGGEPVYLYKVIILQSVPITVDIIELTIMSEFDSVTIPERDFRKKNRKTGIDFAQDILVYTDDPGKINRVVDGILNKMVIKVKTQNNKVYTLYPSTEFIAGLKRVAKWS